MISLRPSWICKWSPAQPVLRSTPPSWARSPPSSSSSLSSSPSLVLEILLVTNLSVVVQVMSTIKGVGNKPLQHANSVTNLPSPAKLPKYPSHHIHPFASLTSTTPGTGLSPHMRKSLAFTLTTLRGASMNPKAKASPPVSQYSGGASTCSRSRSSRTAGL